MSSKKPGDRECCWWLGHGSTVLRLGCRPAQPQIALHKLASKLPHSLGRRWWHSRLAGSPVASMPCNHRGRVRVWQKSSVPATSGSITAVKQASNMGRSTARWLAQGAAVLMHVEPTRTTCLRELQARVDQCVGVLDRTGDHKAALTPASRSNPPGAGAQKSRCEVWPCTAAGSHQGPCLLELGARGATLRQVRGQSASRPPALNWCFNLPQPRIHHINCTAITHPQAAAAWCPIPTHC